MNEPNKTDEQRIVILDALGLSLASKKNEAIAEKATSGIEDDWTQDQEFYDGYDDANRHEFAGSATRKIGDEESQEKVAGSVVFPNITAPYVDAVSARVGDILIPTGNKNFSVHPTPFPEMLPEEEEPAQPQDQAAQPGQPGQPLALTPVVSAIEQLRLKFNKLKKEANRKAEKAENKIDDWLSECQFHGEMRKVLDDAAKLGSGVLKGPVPVKRRSMIWKENALVMVEDFKPASVRVDPWNLFPDGACGESIHNGSYIWERDFLTPKRLEDMKGTLRPSGSPVYIDSQIDLCLKEGPKESEKGDVRNLPNQTKKGQFVIWYAHISVTAEELIAAGCDCGPEEGRQKSYPAKITMVNDRVIGASLNPLDSGEFPYDVIPWKRRPNMPWGTGLARQLRTPQRIVTGATRRLMDNAGLASGPQLVVRRGVTPENGIWEIVPLKFWREDDDATGQTADPVKAVVIPMLQEQLTNIIQLGMKMAEDVTGMPMLMQGQQGKAPDTVGGMNILNNNANSVLRRIARLFDSCITEPHIRRYYAWLMEYDEDADCKGDFQIVAHGSTVLVERDIQAQEMVNILQLTQNPIFEKNPKKAMDEYLKSRRFDPETFDYSEEEMKAIKAQPPQQAPAVQVAQIREQGQLEREKLESQQINDRIAAEAHLAMNQQKFEQAENERDRDNKLAVAVINERMKSTELTSAERQTLDKIKAQLAGKSMDLTTQTTLSRESMAQANDHVAAGHKVDIYKHQTQVARPAVEPRGRAPAGQAYIK